MRKKKLKIEKGDEKDLEVERLINEGLTETETGQSSDEEEIRKTLIPLLTRVLHRERSRLAEKELRRVVVEEKKAMTSEQRAIAKERREKAKLSKAEREMLDKVAGEIDKLLEEIARKLKKLEIRKGVPVFPEETRKYMEEAKKKYPELIEE